MEHPPASLPYPPEGANEAPDGRKYEGEKMLRKSAVVGMFVAAIMGFSSVSALASPPAANGDLSSARYCVAESGFTLLPTFPFAQAISVDGKGNANGLACVKFLPTPDNAQAQIIVLDDRDRASI